MTDLEKARNDIRNAFIILFDTAMPSHGIHHADKFLAMLDSYVASQAKAVKIDTSSITDEKLLQVVQETVAQHMAAQLDALTKPTAVTPPKAKANG